MCHPKPQLQQRSPADIGHPTLCVRHGQALRGCHPDHLQILSQQPLASMFTRAELTVCTEVLAIAKNLQIIPQEVKFCLISRTLICETNILQRDREGDFLTN